MEEKIENLVFEGGGVKGCAYGGALRTMEQLGKLKKVKRVGGTSAGAITACLMALGYTPDEIARIVTSTKFTAFQDDSFGFIRDSIRLARFYGWHKGDALKSWIDQFITDKLGRQSATFADLKQKTEIGHLNHNLFKELYIVVTNLTKQKAEIYSYDTTPDMPIADAVRTSMSIPIYFQSVLKDGDIMVDGGVATNFPIKMFDKRVFHKSGINDPNMDRYVVNPYTIGFRLDTKEEIKANQDWGNADVEINNFGQFMGALVFYLMEAANKKHLRECDRKRTIFIETGNVKATDFDLKEKDIIMLVNNGAKAVKQYFEARIN